MNQNDSRKQNRSVGPQELSPACSVSGMPGNNGEISSKLCKSDTNNISMPCNGNAIIAPPRGEAEARRKGTNQTGVEDVHQPPN